MVHFYGSNKLDFAIYKQLHIAVLAQLTLSNLS